MINVLYVQSFEVKRKIPENANMAGHDRTWQDMPDMARYAGYARAGLSHKMCSGFLFRFRHFAGTRPGTQE